MANPLLLMVVLVVAFFAISMCALGGSVYNVYIGSYTDNDIRGISLLEFDTTSGELKHTGLAAEAPNPTFLALHPSGKFLYAVSEQYGANGGSVISFAINPDGTLKQLSQQPAGGKGPCHVATDAAGKCLMVANYGSGTFQIYPLKDDGTIGTPGDPIKHEGGSVVKGRQDGPHAHGIYPDPTGQYALAVDLGTDQVAVYRLDAAKAALAQPAAAAGRAEPGAGPRHLAFSLDGKHVYVVNELNSTVTMYEWDSAAPSLTAVQTIGTLPEGFTGKNSTAEIAVHPEGRMLYASNRGHNSIAVYAIEPGTGRLALHAHQPTEGGEPRHFAIDPTGRWMLVTNQKGNNVVVLAISPSGELQATGRQLPIKAAVCALFVPKKD